MIMPRGGEQINVVPYGPALVDKILGDGKVRVSIDRIFKRPDGMLTNMVVVELHPVWVPSSQS